MSNKTRTKKMISFCNSFHTRELIHSRNKKNNQIGMGRRRRRRKGHKNRRRRRRRRRRTKVLMHIECYIHTDMTFCYFSMHVHKHSIFFDILFPGCWHITQERVTWSEKNNN